MNQCGGDIRAECGFVAGEVVGVGVRDESAWFRVRWVEPQVGFRQVKATLETNFDHARSETTGLRGMRKGNQVEGTVRAIKRGRGRRGLESEILKPTEFSAPFRTA